MQTELLPPLKDCPRGTESWPAVWGVCWGQCSGVARAEWVAVEGSAPHRISLCPKSAWQQET